MTTADASTLPFSNTAVAQVTTGGSTTRGGRPRPVAIVVASGVVLAAALAAWTIERATSGRAPAGVDSPAASLLPDSAPMLSAQGAPSSLAATVASAASTSPASSADGAATVAPAPSQAPHARTPPRHGRTAPSTSTPRTDVAPPPASSPPPPATPSAENPLDHM